MVGIGDTHLMITKGALTNILDVCSSAETNDGKIVEIGSVKDQILKHYEEFSNNGFRTLGIAYKNLLTDSAINKIDERDMIFWVFSLFLTPLKLISLKQ